MSTDILFRRDLLYIIITGFIIIANIIALVFVILNHLNDDINLIRINIFENISKDYFVCFSIVMSVIGWQNEISKQLVNFKIKTAKRFYKVVYLFFIIELFLIIFICFSSTSLISVKDDLVIFFLDFKNSNLEHNLIIEIMSIIFCILIQIIIGNHLQLIHENLLLILKLFSNNYYEEDYEINKYFSIIFYLFILIVSNIICIFIEDKISIIILLFGGIITPILNYLVPTILYCVMVSSNSIVSWFAWVISLFIISLGIVGFILNIML